MAELVTIARFGQLSEAEMARMTLEGNGIQAFLTDTHSVGNRPFLASAMGGVRLQVLDFDVRRARECLDSSGLAFDGTFFDAFPGIMACPKCKGTSIKYKFRDKILLVLAMLTFGLTIIWRPKRTCSGCGHTWV